ETLTCGKRQATNHSIPACAPLNLPPRDLPIDPYTLGVWLGDGETAGAPLSGHDDDVEIIEHVRAAGYEVDRQPCKSKSTPNWAVRGLCRQLRQARLLGNKHIPPPYLRASAEQRLALLQGLMDTDGHAPESPTSNFCEFTNTNEGLARQTIELA